MIGRPPFDRAAPRIKSTCPPAPLYSFDPIESAQTWPVRSICTAELIATIFSFWAKALNGPGTSAVVRNRAATGGGIGEWSNLNPDRTRQNLDAVEVQIRNGRKQAVPPALNREGLMIAHHPVGRRPGMPFDAE